MMDIQQPFVTQEQKVKFWTEAKEEIKQLRLINEKQTMSLEKLACLGNGDVWGNSIGNEIAQAALKLE